MTTPAAETVATEWAARGDELISIDLVTGSEQRIELADVPGAVDRIKGAQKQPSDPGRRHHPSD